MSNSKSFLAYLALVHVLIILEIFFVNSFVNSVTSMRILKRFFIFSSPIFFGLHGFRTSPTITVGGAHLLMVAFQELKKKDHANLIVVIVVTWYIKNWWMINKSSLFSIVHLKQNKYHGTHLT